MSTPDKKQENFVGKFAPLFDRLRELQQRFRPGHPYVEKSARKTKRPHSHRKAEARRKNKAARIARRKNRRQK
jgi:hypothetical protein